MYYNLSAGKTLKVLGTSKEGLSGKKAKELLEKNGQNKLPTKRVSQLKIFFSQFNNFLVYILLFALLVSIAVPFYEENGVVTAGDFLDAYAIGAILLVNALLGFFQERKAQRAIELLKELSSPKSLVRRDGKEKWVKSEDLVVGDIVLLEAGTKISADGRLLETVELQINESSLTGESSPVKKIISGYHKKVALADQKNMVFSGTSVVAGRGLIVVTATGQHTELGKIASLVQTSTSPRTPLQRRLARIGKVIGVLMLVISALVFIVGIIRDLPIVHMLLFAISLAVASVPEGLPAIVTITLALSIGRLLRKNVLVRKIRSVESLGSVTVICSDKTGTITENKMKVTDVYFNNKMVKSDKLNPKKVSYLLEAASSCNNASLPNIGDPTDLAVLTFGMSYDIAKRERVGEIPFSSEKKFMRTDHIIDSKKISFLKGAPEKILSQCGFIFLNGKVVKLDEKGKNKLLEKNTDMASSSLRVVSCAYVQSGKTIFLGLIGMIDPPRKGVKSSINLCKKAGIRTVMITGDHVKTAEAIAKKVGIPSESIQGEDIEKMTEAQLSHIVDKVSVYARVSPHHKVRILLALQKKGETVAMTGDGVNDAPALKKSDVGVAMGIAGTDVSKDTADLVLLDDNFSTIVSAVHQGRIIYDNIKKSVKFLFAANLGEVLIVLLSLLIFYGNETLILPFLPLHLLWVNLITDSLPALSLSVEKGEKNVMARGPNKPKKSILHGSFSFVIIAGIISTIVVLILFSQYVNLDIEKARTIALTTLVMFELFLVFSARSKEPLHKVGFFSNKWMIIAVAISVILHLIALYTPLNEVMHLVPLSLAEWAMILPLALSGFIFFEIKKLFTKSKV